MKSLLMCIVCVGMPAAALAGEPLTWEECAREAGRRNPSLEAAKAAVRKARANYAGSYSAFLPQVSADLGVDRGAKKTGGSSSSLDANTAGVSASETLFSGFLNEAQVQQQRATLNAEEAAFDHVKAQVGFDLKSAFAQLLFAQEQVSLAESIAARRQDNARLVELRYQAGREHQGSFLRSQAASQQAAYDVASATRALQVARQQLAKALGRKDGAALSVTGALNAAAPGHPPDFAALMTQTPAHRQAEAEARSAKAGVTIARSGFFPTVSATGSLSRLGTDWPPGDRRWLAGLTVSLPLFTGGETWFEVRSAKAEWERIAASLRSTDDQALFALGQAFAAHRDAADKVGVQQEFLHAARVREEISNSQYAAGLLSFQDWDLIEDDLIANQKAMLASQRDAVVAEATWERVKGASPLP